MSTLNDIANSVFGRINDSIDFLTLLRTCDGMWKQGDKAIWLLEDFVSKGSKAESLAEGVFKIHGSDGLDHIIVTDKASVTEEVIKLVFGSKINLNTADVLELTELKGIGIKTAEKIVAKRPYATVEDLPVSKPFEHWQNQGRFCFKAPAPVKFLSAEVMATKAAKQVAGLVSKAQVGQEYGQMPVMEAIPTTGKNIKFVPKEEGSNFRGRSYADQIMAESATWDSSINAVFFIEESKALKKAIDAEEEARKEAAKQDKEIPPSPLTEQSLAMKEAFSWLHNKNSGSPFVFAATDNGFCLVHSVLVDLYVQFAEKHVNATQYLKVITGTVLKPDFVQVAIVDDFKVDAVNVGTDGMSYIDASYLAKQQIKRGTGIQFRALSANVVKAMQEADFTDYCKAFKEVFNPKSSGMEMFLKGFQLPEVQITVSDLEVSKLKLPAAEKAKADKGYVATAKEYLKSEGLYEAVKAKYESTSEGKSKKAAAKLYNRMIVEAYEACFKADFVEFKGETNCNGLFAKGAATPALDIGKTLESIAGKHVGFKPDMIIPVANFKALGKEYLKGAKKMMKSDGSFILVVEMHVAPISIKNGGNMRVTPHVQEAAGTAESKCLTEHSLFTYAEAYDQMIADGIFNPGNVNPGATAKQLGDDRETVFSYEGKSYIEPWCLTITATLDTIKEFEAEEFHVHGMKDSSFAMLDPMQRSDALVSLSKKMTDQMIGGPKRQACFFAQMQMASFVPYGTVVVPDHIAKKAYHIGGIVKQPVQSNANHQRVELVGFSEYAEELFQLGLITKNSKGKWVGLKDLNLIMVSPEWAEDEGYADDDGDDAAIVYIDKEDPKLFQVANVLVGPVKSKSMAINAAELSPMSVNSPEKNKAWRDSTGRGKLGFDYVGGTYIGLFVNNQSLFKALGEEIELPEALVPFMSWKRHISMALQFFAEYEGQNELDDAKKTKVQVLFMVVLCCMQKRYHIDMVRSGWKGKSILTQSELEASGLDAKFVRKTENTIEEAALTKLLEAWETRILNGERWVEHTLDLEDAGLELNDFGKAYLKGKTKVLVKNPSALENSEYFDEHPEEEIMNMLWMPRMVWEQYYGDTPLYLGAFKSIWLPGLSTQHNWVSYFRTGWRFLSKESLAGKKAKVEEVDQDGNVKIKWVYVPSPLLPSYDKDGFFIPYFNPQRAKSAQIPGFYGVVLTGWSYLGPKTINAMKHEQWLLAAWRKWEAMSGIPMFRNEVKDGEIAAVAPMEAMSKMASMKKHNGAYELPWYYVTGQTTIDMKLNNGTVAPATRNTVHSHLFGLNGKLDAEHFYPQMLSWFRSFGLNPEKAKAEDETVFTVRDIKFLLREVRAGRKSNLFAGTQFWNEHNRDEDEEAKGAKSLKAALFFNAVAYAGLSYDDYLVLFKAIGDRHIFNKNKKNKMVEIRVAAEGDMPAIIRICRYDMLELVSIQDPEGCEFTKALASQSWEKFQADKTQEVAMKAHASHEHFTGIKLQDCPTCRAKLKLELKRLGRGKASKEMKVNTQAAADWLNYIICGYKKPLLMIGATDLASVQKGMSLAPADMESLLFTEFYSEIQTQNKSFHWTEGEKGNLEMIQVKKYKKTWIVKEDVAITVNSKSNGVGGSVLYPAGFDIEAWKAKSAKRTKSDNTHGSTFLATLPIFERKVDKVQLQQKTGWVKKVDGSVCEFVPTEPLNFFQTQVEKEPTPPTEKTTKINISTPIVEDSVPVLIPDTAPLEEQPGAGFDSNEGDYLAEIPFDDNQGEYEVVEDQPVDESLIQMLGEDEPFIPPFEDLDLSGPQFDEPDFEGMVMLGLDEVDTLTGKASTPSAPAAPALQVVKACEGWILHPEEAAAGTEIYPCVGRRAKVVAEEDYFLFPFMVDGKKQLLEVIKDEDAPQA